MTLLVLLLRLLLLPALAPPAEPEAAGGEPDMERVENGRGQRRGEEKGTQTRLEKRTRSRWKAWLFAELYVRRLGKSSARRDMGPRQARNQCEGVDGRGREGAAYVVLKAVTESTIEERCGGNCMRRSESQRHQAQRVCGNTGLSGAVAILCCFRQSIAMCLFETLAQGLRREVLPAGELYENKAAAAVCATQPRACKPARQSPARP